MVFYFVEYTIRVFFRLYSNLVDTWLVSRYGEFIIQIAVVLQVKLTLDRSANDWFEAIKYSA